MLPRRVLEAFDTPGVRLIDTDGKGVERITEKGVVVAGVECEVDCIIYASGFEFGTEYTRRAGFDLTGRGRLKLSQAWAEGMESCTASMCTDFSMPSLCSSRRTRIDHEDSAQSHRSRTNDRDGGPARA